MIAFAMQNEGGNADGGQDRADVDLRVHAQERDGRPRASRASEIGRGALGEGGVVHLARSVMFQVN